VRGIFSGLIASVSEQQEGPAFDADLYAHAVLAVVEHFGRLLLDDPDRFTTERMVDGATRLLRLLWR
jgi:hypothetical protein